MFVKDSQKPRSRLPKLLAAEVRAHLYKRRFLVPNAVTLGNMFCGFLCTIYAASGRFEKAVIAIALALLLDGLDGRVARKLNATSKFGVEFDSFSDLVSFGVAPALLMYHWCFRPVADEFGVLITFIFTLCAASRLARFNIASENLKSFCGLPTPGAAAMVAAIVNFSPEWSNPKVQVAFCTVLMLSLAYLMVSKVEFLSIKLVTVGTMRKSATIIIGALIALLWYNNKAGFLVLASSYVLSGPLGMLFKGRLRSKRGVSSERRVSEPPTDSTSL